MFDIVQRVCAHQSFHLALTNEMDLPSRKKDSYRRGSRDFKLLAVTKGLLPGTASFKFSPPIQNPCLTFIQDVDFLTKLKLECHVLGALPISEEVVIRGPKQQACDPASAPGRAVLVARVGKSFNPTVSGFPYLQIGTIISALPLPKETVKQTHLTSETPHCRPQL